jgi:phytoene dehydrogenase-like protein
MPRSVGSAYRAYDAVLIGAGHNALLAPAYLARAGWSTLVLDRSARPGGAVLSDQVTPQGFVHDLFATNMNLFLGSPVAADLGSELERHGLTFADSSRTFANVFPGARALRVHQGAADTLASDGGNHIFDQKAGEGYKLGL